MVDTIKTISFSEIESLLQAISKAEASLIENLTVRMRADLELMEVLEKLKKEFTNLVCVK